MDFPSTPYFPYFHYFEPTITHSHFSTSHTAHGFASSLFLNSFRPVYFLKAHLFISWACNLLFLPLGINGFSIYSLTLFCPCYWASSFFWTSENDHQQCLNYFFSIMSICQICSITKGLKWRASVYVSSPTLIWNLCIYGNKIVFII